MCDSRLQVRRATYPLYSWLRTGGHGCQDVETHQIDSEIDWTVPLANGGMSAIILHYLISLHIIFFLYRLVS